MSARLVRDANACDVLDVKAQLIGIGTRPLFLARTSHRKRVIKRLNAESAGAQLASHIVQQKPRPRTMASWWRVATVQWDLDLPKFYEQFFQLMSR